jgi:ribosomal protein S27AE
MSFSPYTKAFLNYHNNYRANLPQLGTILKPSVGGLRQLSQYGLVATDHATNKNGDILPLHENFFVNESQMLYGILSKNPAKDHILERYKWKYVSKTCPNCSCGLSWKHDELPYYKCGRCMARFTEEAKTGHEWRHRGGVTNLIAPDDIKKQYFGGRVEKNKRRS